jgi:hypothetical protein
MTSLQENAILAQIAKTLMYKEFLEGYIEDAAAPGHPSNKPLQHRASENLRHIKEVAAPDGRNLAQFMHATLTTTKQADRYRTAARDGEAALEEYFEEVQQSLAHRAAIHFDPEKPGLYAALKTFGHPQTAGGLKAASAKILAGDIPCRPSVRDPELTPEQLQALRNISGNEM